MEPEGGGAGVDSVDRGLVDSLFADLGGGDFGESFGGGEADFVVVDVLSEGFRPGEYVESIEDPVEGARDDGGDAFCTLGMVLDQVVELAGFFDGREV